MKIEIFTAERCSQKKYTSQVVTWEELEERLSIPEVTEETSAEYDSYDGTRRSFIKDVGGFVGGTLKDGLRQKGSVIGRQVVCLDADTAKENLWDVWLDRFGFNAAMHSTHSSRPGAPRYRLVIPLSEPVNPDEYTALCGIIMNRLGGEQFDQTTCQPERLMFWPSVSLDAAYEFHSKVDREYLNPENYVDRKHPVKASIEPVKPEDKAGSIGLFCRTYSIYEAIENFVPDYEPCGENRYTYVKGSTAGGVVIYEGCYSYSFHGTDPACGQRCNAFDLVRIHRFGSLDDGSQARLPGRMPSFRAMSALVDEDPKCKATREAEITAELSAETEDMVRESSERIEAGRKEAAARLGITAEDDSRTWSMALQRGKSGTVLATDANLDLIMQNDGVVKGLFAFDEFSGKACFTRLPSWRGSSQGSLYIDDSDDAFFRKYISISYGIRNDKITYDAVTTACRSNPFHPVREWLDSLVWDGTERARTLFIDYFGVEDSDYARALTWKVLLGAVKRVYQPGCKFDTMLTLQGPQGCGKSSFLRRLSHNPDWFSDSPKDIRSKDSMEALRGKWLIEMPEMASIKKADIEATKAFISSQCDQYRAAYGRRSESIPRQCVMIATTNETAFLTDTSGNRRFQILAVSPDGRGVKDPKNIPAEEVEQVWAEVKSAYDRGDQEVHLSDEEARAGEEIQRAFMIDDPRTPIIADFLDRKITSDWDSKSLADRVAWMQDETLNETGTVERTRVCCAEIWCEALGHYDTRSMTKMDSAAYNRIMALFPEWQKYKSSLRFGPYKTQQAFVRRK